MAEPVSQNAPEDDPDRSEENQPRLSRSEERGGARRRRAKPAKKRSFWKELPILLVIALVLTILIQTFLAKVFMIPSGSMEATLHGCPGCTGDRILVDRVTYDFTEPGPGDVVVFKGPQAWINNEIPPQESSNIVVRGLRGLGSLVGFAPPDERDFVKRVIAVGGQTVQCCDPQGRVIVDGKALDEPYVYWEDPSNPNEKPFEPVKVPAGMVWVMGDNRNNSDDSRFQGGGGVNGAVPVDNIIGKARIIVLPPGRWGGITDHNPQESAQPVALGAPEWQSGLPLGAGIAAAWPALFLGRKLKSGLRRTAGRKS
ncbi:MULTISPECIES: signal peptidase I [unclassified Amycolatopsis]|uniref:signal peptidase I n=1 Tax=unclassified Amycolatopsis TaxID=2618356 RepID=UPI002E12222C|nr:MULTISPECIES: signal peptidase I [unclassified Amycolatopsis]WSJ77260.1 signal peptidase I [Amycolatopsis sp. NBC_01307]WSK79190.1 signal peptidase I [Amycolatopsis sp. NBC_01286]